MMKILFEKFGKSEKIPNFAIPNDGAVAQMVEQWTENPCVGSSILPSTTRTKGKYLMHKYLPFSIFEVLTKMRLFLGYLFSSEVYFDMIRRNKSQAEDSSSAEIASIFSNRPWA